MKHPRSYQRPPLPFIGSKLRWWRELQTLAMQMPKGGCVFDAFGGSMSAARVIKDTRPDLTVITNDYGHDYRRRLDAAPQTAEVLKQLQAVAPKRSYVEYTSFDEETRAKCMTIVAQAEDEETAWRWLNGRGYVSNKIPTGEPVCPKTCDEWTKGLVVIDDALNASEAKYWAESGAFVILDPPYMGSVKMGFDMASTYRKDGRIDAQAFCAGYMRLSANWCLFEKPNSALAMMAKDKGAIEIRRNGKRNRQTVDEVMLVSSEIVSLS